MWLVILDEQRLEMKNPNIEPIELFIKKTYILKNYNKTFFLKRNQRKDQSREKNDILFDSIV